MIALLLVLLLGSVAMPAHAQQLPPSNGQGTPAAGQAGTAGGQGSQAEGLGSGPAGSPMAASPGSSSADPQTGTGFVPGISSGAAPAAASAATPKPYPGSRDLPDLLGLTLQGAFSGFGVPEEIFPLRGSAAWQDDVVFYYPDHSYLFWYQDRVWQVRVDRRYALPVLGGVTMGSSTADVEGILGTPFHTGTNSLVFILPDRGYPVRARLFFTDDKLVDLYVYRGDF